MVKITKNLVPSNLASKLTYSGSFNKTHIVIHETANKARGAGATTHGNLQANGNSRQASWTYQVDDKHAVQSFPDKAGCWHASNPTYNRNSIGIEICVNSDSNYKKAVQNAAELTKSLMKKHGIPAKNVIQHYTASGGKNCPAQMRSGNYGITWNQFKKMIGDSSGKTTSGGSTSSSGSKYKSVGSKWTGQVLRQYDKGGAVKDLQKLIGEKADGYFGPSTRKKVIAAQKKAGVSADGTPGPDSYKAFTGKKSSSNKSSNMAVDGKWGQDVTKGLQRVFGTPVDGKLSGQSSNPVTRALYSNTASFGSGGSVVIRAMQKKLGVTADGLLGPATIRALQKRMGTPVDGKLSKVSPMVKELQKRLNKGTF